MAGSFWDGIDDFLETSRMPFPQLLPSLPSHHDCHRHHLQQHQQLHHQQQQQQQQQQPQPQHNNNNSDNNLRTPSSFFGHGSSLRNRLGTSLPRASDLWHLRPGVGQTQDSWTGGSVSNFERPPPLLTRQHHRVHPPPALPLSSSNILPLPVADPNSLLTPPATIGPPWAPQTYSALPLPAWPALPGTSFQREPNSDDILLNELVTRNFSSPSIPPQNPSRADDHHASSSRPSSSSWTANSGVSGADNRTRGTVFSVANLITKTDEDCSGPPPPLSSPNRQDLPGSSSMPPLTRKRRADGISESRPAKRQKNSYSSLRPSSAKRSFQFPGPETIDLVKREDDPRQDRAFFDSEEGDEDVIDLINDELPASLKALDVDNSIKISAFQCVICMENVTDLTVTHCGHLFCSECLHQSLHVDATKKVCPICRQKIDVKPGSGGKFGQKAKGFYPLELKLMTPKRLGKLKAR